MDDRAIFIIICVLVLFGCYLLYKLFYNRRAVFRRTLRKAPLTPITNAKDGELVRVIGTVDYLDQPLTAPFSKRKGVFYYLRVEERKTSGSGSSKSHHWTKVHDEHRAKRFWVVEGKHRALVDEEEVEGFLEMDEGDVTGFGIASTKQIEKFLMKRKVKTHEWYGMPKTLGCKEGIVSKGERVVVWGRAQWVDAAEIEGSKYQGKVLRITATDVDPVHLSDKADVLSIR
ncbi:MAG: hypothetical protein ACFB10_08850 [Salibacteraceae bacterium]